MFCSAWHNSCLVWILSHPNFWQLHQDQWFWTCCLFPSKWSSLSWLHPKVTPKSNLPRTLVLQAPNVYDNREERLISCGIDILLRMIKIESTRDKATFTVMNSIFFYFFKHRPLCFFVIHITWPGLTGFRANHTLAVFAGITLGCGQLSNHHLGGNQWWVQTHWSRWSCQKMGRKEIQTKHELWQDEQSNEVSCKVFIFFRSYIT